MLQRLTQTQSADFKEFLINGFTFDAPLVPVLLQILSGAQSAADLVPKGSIYGLDANKSVEITIPAGALGGPVSVARLVD
jgi:iron transport multicopper oxidase